ncbi:lysophospholipid acyltransferase family protein [Coraliomargarita parva]|uniref:lysophospholipid acyltransferase family protein n=1 Tax=Coraliomargarita parva TaxID=3014050 RepID=UPI0022B5B938|nr:lysophospholipid acyltransferase family protein [Coraliomargarita parva]
MQAKYHYRSVDYMLWPLWVVVYYVYLLLFVLLVVCFNIGSLITCLLPRGPWRVAFYQKGIHYCSRFFIRILRIVRLFRLEYVGFERIERGSGSKPLLVANHPSLFDVFLFYCQLPRITCIYKASLKQSLMRGNLEAQLGFISNADPLTMIREGKRKVQEGEQLLIFPEGTRTLEWPVNDFRLGAVAIARQSGVPLQTVLVHYINTPLAKGWSVSRIPRLPMCIRLELGECFHPADYEDSRSMNAALQAYFSREVGGSGHVV